MNKAVVFWALAVAAACEQRPTPPSPPDARVGRVLAGLRPPIAVAGRPVVHWQIAERMEMHHVPGASVAIIDGGRIAWAGGFGVGHADATDPITTSTLFQAQSISKAVTATAALALAASGTLSLDAPVNAVLTSWKLPDNALQAIEKVTLRRLLSHSAGVTVGGFAGYRSGQPLPTVLQILNGEPPANNPPIRVDAVPGSLSRYSGGGMMIVQQMLTDATGESFPSLMRRLVLEPAGMTLSTFDQPLPAPREREAASGHDGQGAVVEGRWPVQPELAAGGLWTTPSELARWAIEIANAWNGQSGTLLSQKIAAEMLSVQKAPYGLGPQIEGTGESLSFSHAGSIWGFRARFIMFPAVGKGAVVMTNADGGDALAGELLTAIATEYAWPSGAQTERTAITLTTTQLDGLAGRYVLPPAPDGTPVYFEISREGQQLFAQLTGLGIRPRAAIYPATADSFFFDNGLTMTFSRDRSGRGLTLSGGGIQGIRRP